MNIVFGFGHPAQVHLFRNIIGELVEKKHKIFICCNDRENVQELLELYGFSYELYGENHPQIYIKALDLFRYGYFAYSFFKECKADLVISAAHYFFLHAAKLLNIPSLYFTDTEDAKLINSLAFPFSHIIFTPSCFQVPINYGYHIPYQGYHELAYLHPNYFTPNPKILSELGLSAEDPFFILHFSSWDSSHDIGHRGFASKTEMITFVNFLSDFGRVLITSEIQLPESLEKYRYSSSPLEMHNLLWYASMYVGEGHTMATESAILGTPSVMISSRMFKKKGKVIPNLGNHVELQNYGLLHAFQNFRSAVPEIKNLLLNKRLKVDWRKRRENLLKDKIDVTKFVVDFVDKYPQSFEEYKKGINMEI